MTMQRSLSAVEYSRDEEVLAGIAKEQGIPAIYYTNNISARPLFFAAGAATVLGMVSGLLARKEVFLSMKEYFTT